MVLTAALESILQIFLKIDIIMTLQKIMVFFIILFIIIVLLWLCLLPLLSNDEALIDGTEQL